MATSSIRTGYLVWAVDNVVYGPVPLSLLIQWVEDGRVQQNTWIFNEASDSWRKAGKIDELREWFKEEDGTDSVIPKPFQSPRDIEKLQPGALRRIKILSVLDDVQLERFRERLCLISVPPWKLVVKQGEPADGMYLIMEGELRVRLLVGGKETIVATLEAGEFFGELSLFDNGPRSADVIANTDAVLLKLTASELQKLVSEDPVLAAPFLTAVCKTVAARMRADNKRYANSLNMAHMTAVKN